MTLSTVIDANVTLALVLPLPYSAAAEDQFRAWCDEGVRLIAPSLWSYEIVSALRKAEVLDRISARTAQECLDDILAMGVEEVAPTPRLHTLALGWASRLGQTVAYDAAYLALADQEQSEFWTADKALAAKAESAGLASVRVLK